MTPSSAIPELPGVTGIIIIMIRRICAAYDSRKIGGSPNPRRINDGMKKAEDHIPIVKRKARKSW